MGTQQLDLPCPCYPFSTRFSLTYTTHRNRSGDEIYHGIELECTICGEVNQVSPLNHLVNPI